MREFINIVLSESIEDQIEESLKSKIRAGLLAGLLAGGVAAVAGTHDDHGDLPDDWAPPAEQADQIASWDAEEAARDAKQAEMLDYLRRERAKGDED